LKRYKLIYINEWSDAIYETQWSIDQHANFCKHILGILADKTLFQYAINQKTLS